MTKNELNTFDRKFCKNQLKKLTINQKRFVLFLLDNNEGEENSKFRTKSMPIDVYCHIMGVSDYSTYNIEGFKMSISDLFGRTVWIPEENEEVAYPWLENASYNVTNQTASFRLNNNLSEFYRSLVYYLGEG